MPSTSAATKGPEQLPAVAAAVGALKTSLVLPDAWAVEDVEGETAMSFAALQPAIARVAANRAAGLIPRSFKLNNRELYVRRLSMVVGIYVPLLEQEHYSHLG